MTQHARSTQKIVSYSHAENEGIQKGEFHAGGHSPRGGFEPHYEGNPNGTHNAAPEGEW